MHWCRRGPHSKRLARRPKPGAVTRPRRALRAETTKRQREPDSPSQFYSGLVAELYEPLAGPRPARPPTSPFIDRFGTPTLELACGSGLAWIELLERGCPVEGLDPSDDTLDPCRSRAAERGGIRPPTGRRCSPSGCTVALGRSLWPARASPCSRPTKTPVAAPSRGEDLGSRRGSRPDRPPRPARCGGLRNPGPETVEGRRRRRPAHSGTRLILCDHPPARLPRCSWSPGLGSGP